MMSRLRVERDGLGDLDDLLVGDREAAAPGGAGRCATPSRCEEAPASAYIAARSIRRPPPQRLAAHEDVLGDREVGEERRLLVDHRDAGGLGLGGRAEVDVLAAGSRSVPASRRWTPATILTSVDLPAPFSPTSAWIEPRLDAQRAGAQRHDRAERLGTSRSSSTGRVARSGHRIGPLRLKGFNSSARTVGDRRHCCQGCCNETFGVPRPRRALNVSTLSRVTGACTSEGACSATRVASRTSPRAPASRSAPSPTCSTGPSGSAPRPGAGRAGDGRASASCATSRPASCAPGTQPHARLRHARRRQPVLHRRRPGHRGRRRGAGLSLLLCNSGSAPTARRPTSTCSSSSACRASWSPRSTRSPRRSTRSAAAAPRS